MKERDTPLKLVRLWEKMPPGIYKTLDGLKAAKGSEGLDWPSYCDLPIGAAFTCLVEQEQLTPPEAAIVAAELTACYTWRKNKIVFSFDQDFAQMLVQQVDNVKDTDVLPTEIIFHLPYPCIYIKAKCYAQFDGFWAWIEHDINENRAELRIQWVSTDMEHSMSLVLHLIPGKNLRDCIQDTAKVSLSHIKADIKPQSETIGMEEAAPILPAIQLLLYLLSDYADIDDVVPMTVQKSKKREFHIIQDKAGEVQEKSVGVRIGNTIRKHRIAGNSEGTGSSSVKRPHSRRGHWHHYWTGPVSGERKLVLKWVAPTFIHQDLADAGAIVIFPVKD